MSQREKLIARFLAIPKDFTIDELDSLMSGFGMLKGSRGKTSGSAIEYFYPPSGRVFKIHSPHPGRIVKTYALRAAVEFLSSENLIKKG